LPADNGDAIAEALAPLQDELDKATEMLATALSTLGSLPDLTTFEEQDLMGQDSAQISRVVYVTALLRLASALRSQPRSLREELTQGNLALGYVKHIESANLRAMHFGRNQADQQLAVEVGSLRQKLSELASYKARNREEDVIDVTDEAQKDS